MSVWFHLVYILHLPIHPYPACIHTSPTVNLTILSYLTTGCVSHRLLSPPMPQQSFVLMHFSSDIQTSSCLKPLDPFMLCLCHCKQQPSDNGGGVRSGPQIFLIGSLRANKRAFFSLAEGVKSCWDEASSISGRGGSNAKLQ